uniref:Uncharacterized protein LOC100187063 n=1 Tax=Phallusia mammillata TaxID=59560 RepID=A0A6F9DJA5_9ASCI|nr:uncharacterized protein LOC100187063 [Phallusia mammillata]
MASCQLHNGDPTDPMDVIKTHLQDMWPMQNGNYVAGYVDGKEKLDTFLNEYNCICSTTYSVRTSVKKSSNSKSKEKRRYGSEDRIYWELSNGQPKIPFMGIPFIVRSSMAKECQYGPRYYKPKKKSVGNEKAERRTRNVYSKKKNCPAQIVIREIVIFVDFSLPPISEGNFYRQRKKELIKELREKIGVEKLSTVTRFYIQVPLPNAHQFHPSIPNKLPKSKTDSIAKQRKNIDSKFLNVLSEISNFDYTSVAPEAVETATKLLQQAVETMKTENASFDIIPSNAGKTKTSANEQQHPSKKCKKTVLQETQNESNASTLNSTGTYFSQPVVHHISTFHQYSSTKQTAQAKLIPSLSTPEETFHPFPLPSLPTKTKSQFFHTPLHTVKIPQHMYNTTVSNPWRQF